jgi:hypothetical protein
MLSFKKPAQTLFFIAYFLLTTNSTEKAGLNLKRSNKWAWERYFRVGSCEKGMDQSKKN